jgi:hypothetical protein
MMHATGPATEPSVEVRFTVDATEPRAYARDDEGFDVEVLGPGGWATLTPPLDAREWAGELYAAVSVAHREATGDSHALTDDELAAFAPDGYDAAPGILVVGDGDERAVVRIHLVVDVAGDCLSTSALREELVDRVTVAFNTTRVAASAGEVRCGSVWQPPEPE